MTKDEALDLALKTLRSVAGELYRVTSYCDTYDALAETNNAIMDIQQARLAHVQKRPQNCGTGYCSCVECVMEPAPVQELIYQMQMMDGKWIDQAKQSYEYNKAHGHTVRIVYTTPPAAQRQWVGLTDEEIGALDYSGTRAKFVKAIEAKIKEKNT